VKHSKPKSQLARVAATLCIGLALTRAGQAADSNTAIPVDTATAQEVMGGAAPADPTKPVSQPSALSLTSTQDSTTATLKGTFGGNRRLTPDEQTTSAFTATLTTPVTKNTNSTDLASLDGFATATALALQASQFRLHVLQEPLAELRTLTEACAAHELAAYRLAQQYLSALKRDTSKAATIVAALQRSSICNDFVPSAKQLDTTTFEIRTGLNINDLAPEDRVALTAALEAWREDTQSTLAKRKALRAGYALAYGLTGKVGYETHDYYESPKLTKDTLDAKPWSAGAYLTYVAPGWNWAVTGQYDYQDAYKDQTTKTECPVPAATPPTTCVAGAIGAPSRSVKNLFTLDWRYKHAIPKWFGGDSIAFSPSATYDVSSHVYGASAFLFLFGSSGNSLNGGVSAMWQSDTHRVTAGIFVTQPCSITGQAA
jgi:hypothetical protein